MQVPPSNGSPHALKLAAQTPRVTKNCPGIVPHDEDFNPPSWCEMPAGPSFLTSLDGRVVFDLSKYSYARIGRSVTSNILLKEITVSR